MYKKAEYKDNFRIMFNIWNNRFRDRKIVCVRMNISLILFP